MLSQAGSALVVCRPVEPPDAIIALASHEWERLPAVAALAHHHPSSVVLLTLPAEITDATCHRCSERTGWLVDHGIDAARVRTLDHRGQGTRDEAVAARRYATEHAIRRLAVVTSPYHTRRAFTTFRHVLRDLPVEVGIVPASQYSPARPARWWMQAYDRAYVAYEWAAGLYYRLKFGIPLGAGPDKLPPAACADESSAGHRSVAGRTSTGCWNRHPQNAPSSAMAHWPFQIRTRLFPRPVRELTAA